MIERGFIVQKTKEYNIKKYIESRLSGAGVSKIKLKKIPLGEKIIVYTSRPSLIVGSKGSNIHDLTRALKKEFNLENPQIEIDEVKNIFLDANVVAEKIVSSLERFGSARFKGVGHKMMENVLNAGALGIEITISGKIPGARAKSWRFYQGYLKKCGDVAISGVLTAKKSALLKSGIIGVKVSIMPPDLDLPDKIEILAEPLAVAGGDGKEPKKEEAKKEEEKSAKKAAKKRLSKKGEEKKEKGGKKGRKEEVGREESPRGEKAEQEGPGQESAAKAGSKQDETEESPVLKEEDSISP